jgi:hypothetical protein
VRMHGCSRRQNGSHRLQRESCSARFRWVSQRLGVSVALADTSRQTPSHWQRIRHLLGVPERPCNALNGAPSANRACFMLRQSMTESGRQRAGRGGFVAFLMLEFAIQTKHRRQCRLFSSCIIVGDTTVSIGSVP